MKPVLSVMAFVAKTSVKSVAALAVAAGVLVAYDGVALAQKGGSGGGTTSVVATIVNTVAQAINVQEAPRQPYSKTFIIVIGDNDESGAVWVDEVPPGKRLIIEHVSGTVTLGDYEHMDFAGIYDNTTQALHYALPMASSNGNGFSNHTFSHPMRAYIGDAGTQDFVVAIRRIDPGPARSGSVTISGYLVDAQ